MPAATTRSILQFDNADMERLLAGIHGGAEAAATVQMRLRYLQRTGYPKGAQAGRGKRVAYEVDNVLRLMLVFQLLDLDLTPARAVNTVETNWTVVARALVASWRALRLSMAADEREHAAQIDELRRVMIVEPAALHGGDGGLTAGLLRPSAFVTMITDTSGDQAAGIVIDLFAIVKILDAAMTGDMFKFKQGEIDAGFERFGETAFGHARLADWLPPRDE